jgi:uncharacterized protein (DUF736 family)
METKNNTGVLFINEPKNDKQPNYKGKAVINGKEMEIAGWKKESKNGAVYLSIVFNEPYKKDAPKDDLPF